MIHNVLCRIAVLVATLLAGGMQLYASSPFEGLDARQAAAVVRRDWRPQYLIEKTLGSDGAWSVIGGCALDAECRLVDWLTSAPGPVAPEGWGMPPEGFSLMEIAPKSWWQAVGTDGLTPVHDLHNLVPVRTGSALDVMAPPAGREGDVARTLMYLAVLYPCDIWPSPACQIFADGSWPMLTPEGRKMLLANQEADPVDAAERLRNERIRAAQGNGNPFVEYPELATLLWADEQPAQPDPEPDPARPVPLKGEYSIAEDVTLWLQSPYVPAGATWEIDGKPVAVESIPLDALGEGTHIIIYKAPHRRGCLKIVVRP